MRAMVFEGPGTGLQLEQAGEGLESLRRGDIRGATVVVPLPHEGEGTSS